MSGEYVKQKEGVQYGIVILAHLPSTVKGVGLVETESDRQESSSHQRWGFGYRAGPGLDEMALKIFLCSDHLFCP